MEPSLSSADFLNLFQLPYLGYENPVVFTDGNYGFSAVKSYPSDYGSLMRIFIRKESLGKSEQPLPVTIEDTYGEKTDGGIRLSANTTSDPIELLSMDEFYFDSTTKKFSRKSGIFKTVKEIEPQKIIEIIHKSHIKPTRAIVGLWLRIKIVFWRNIVANLFKKVSNFFIFLLYITSGTNITRDPWKRIIWPEKLDGEEQQEKIKFSEKKTKEIFGYEAPSWEIVFYCCFHFAIFLIFSLENYKSLLITTIFKNSFLTVVYVITTLFLLDVVVPKCLKQLIKWADKIFYLSSSRRIKI